MRILIVEDEPDLLRSLAQALREEGYAVDTANNGEDGLFNAESYDYDAIVLDVMLPGLDGWEILKRLRKTKKTPVLMLTARDQSRDRVRGLDTGADDYVIKPFDLSELFARLRALIRRSANKTTNVIEIGDVAIDVAARNVFRAEKPVELTAREYA
ncbi:MAG TPA: response regulator, partial [Verrucomicrobiae bacterium]|nr:response regulator [Verrucomicrobiae bacterium]